MGKFKIKTDKQTYNQVKSLLLESGFRISAPTGVDWVIGELGGVISSYSNWRDEPPEWFYDIKEITLLELRAMVNDQYSEIEQVRQAIKVKSGSDSDHALDAMSFGLMGAGAAQASGGVDATLAERQSTYGNFEDVAFVTENIMSILAKVRPDGLQDLPYAHRMALYMIASKMARIVNGDFNHLDSWHDIGGYAKLIEKLIEGE